MLSNVVVAKAGNDFQFSFAMLPEPHRLKSNYDFRRVKRIGRAFHSPLFVFLYAPAKDRSVSRFGFVASTKFDKRAVARNRARRLLREAVRERLEMIKPGFDIILIAKKPIKDVKFQKVSASFHQVLSKVSLI